MPINAQILRSELWIEDVLRRWKNDFAYLVYAYLLVALYIIYGTVW